MKRLEGIREQVHGCGCMIPACINPCQRTVVTYPSKTPTSAVLRPLGNPGSLKSLHIAICGYIYIYI